jgi:hypothetical protein
MSEQEKLLQIEAYELLLETTEKEIEEFHAKIVKSVQKTEIIKKIIVELKK